MKTFKLNPDGFKEIRKKLLLRSAIISLAVISLATIILTRNPKMDGMVLMIFIPVLLGVLFYYFMASIKKQEEVWNSFQVTIDEGIITRSQNTSPNLSINRNQLKEIIHTSEGQIILKTDKRTHFINIPASVQNKEELLLNLSSFGPLSNKEPKKHTLVKIILPLLAIGLVIIVFTLNKKEIVVPAGILLVIGLIASLIMIQITKRLIAKQKGAFSLKCSRLGPLF